MVYKKAKILVCEKIGVKKYPLIVTLLIVTFSDFLSIFWNNTSNKEIVPNYFVTLDCI